ncbi:phage Gp37/Gp68 family protein [candidate division KSB1 bacterium]|nr:phage Gp37/Gp68 family protein [candidate division KSB1 bacterium]
MKHGSILDTTWNPVTGCTKVSPGCAHCYAETITLRFKRGGPFLPGLATIKMHADRLNQPSSWRDPRMVFVNSMGDLFHEEVPFDFVNQVFEVIESCPQHTFQILTKRPERMLEFARDFREAVQWPDNIWAGVSVENQYWAERRIPLLREISSSVRFLSCEPLLKPLTLDLQDIHWVIVGGESGSKARPIEESWVLDIQNQCREAGVAFFFKQWGGITAKSGGRTLDGKTYDEYPKIYYEMNKNKQLISAFV